MQLNRLSLMNFKSYEEVEIEPLQGINCFIGDNGVGKTNLLDALYYLAFSKSFFNPIDSQNIRKGRDFFAIQGDFADESGSNAVHLAVKKGHKKVLKRNKKEYSRLSDHIGMIPLVMISPQDAELINGGSELRRKFVDGIICQLSRPYMDALLKYNKVLQHRNALLKQFNDSGKFDQSSLDLWNDQLIPIAEEIFAERSAFMADFAPLFQQHYDVVSNGREKVTLNYDSTLSQGNFGLQLAESQEVDRRRLHTTVGVHKDDLDFEVDGLTVRKYASQGQQKSFLIALKLAQLSYIGANKSTSPIILLDDIFDKLDDHRVGALIDLVTQKPFGQIFITDTSDQRIHQICQERGHPYRAFTIIKGAVAHVKDA